MDGEPLCPDPALWRLSLVTLGRATVVLHLEPRRGAACCPDCGTESRKVHSRYRRTPWDVPWAKWPVQLVIHARSFFCDNPGCPRVTFSEPFPGVLDAYVALDGHKCRSWSWRMGPMRRRQPGYLISWAMW